MHVHGTVLRAFSCHLEALGNAGQLHRAAATAGGRPKLPNRSGLPIKFCAPSLRWLLMDRYLQSLHN